MEYIRCTRNAVASANALQWPTPETQLGFKAWAGNQVETRLGKRAVGRNERAFPGCTSQVGLELRNLVVRRTAIPISRPWESFWRSLLFLLCKPEIPELQANVGCTSRESFSRKISMICTVVLPASWFFLSFVCVSVLSLAFSQGPFSLSSLMGATLTC